MKGACINVVLARGSPEILRNVALAYGMRYVVESRLFSLKECDMFSKRGLDRPPYAKFSSSPFSARFAQCLGSD